MNDFLQNNLLLIVLILLVIILFLMAIISFFLIKFLISNKELAKSQPPPQTFTQPTENFSSEEQSNVKKLKQVSSELIVEKFFCENHPETPSSGACLICEDVFCEKCLIEHEGLYFCKEHFKTFVNNKWTQITDVKTTPSTPEDGLFIYNFKKQIWVDKEIPSFVLTHYKINIEHDYIESYIQLNVIESKATELKNEIEEYKLNSKRH